MLPVVVQQPRPVTELVGTTATLSCCARGVPMPTIMWFKEDTPIDLSPTRISTNSTADIDNVNCSDLVLLDLVLSDMALYQCNASNDLAEVRSIESDTVPLTVNCK